MKEKYLTMTNPLTSLDELIWKQFEKVTVAANKRLGWNKYDCAYLANIIGNVSFIGYGTYELLLGIEKQSTTGLLDIVVGGGCLIAGGIFLHGSKEKFKQKEEQELRHLAYTAASPPKPNFDPSRPVILAIAAEATTVGLYYLIATATIDPSLTYPSPTLIGLIQIAAGTMISFLQIQRYFEDQLMTPPSTKKSIWKAVTDYVTKPFHKATPQPAESAVRYRTIEDYVSS